MAGLVLTGCGSAGDRADQHGGGTGRLTTGLPARRRHERGVTAPAPSATEGPFGPDGPGRVGHARTRP